MVFYQTLQTVVWTFIHRKIIRKNFSEHWTIYPWLLSYLSTWVHSPFLLPFLFSSGFKISPLKLKFTTLCSRNETWLLHALFFYVLRELIPFQKELYLHQRQIEPLFLTVNLNITPSWALVYKWEKSTLSS